MLKRIVSFLCAMLFAKAVCAQTASGTIFGLVTDQSRAVLSDARITAVNTRTDVPFYAATNESGNYTLELPVGAYRVEVERNGFKKAILPGVLAETRRRNQANVRLEPGEVTESMVVYADGTRLESDYPTVTRAINAFMIRALPNNGSHYESFISLFTGATPPVPISHLSQRGGFNAGMEEHFNSYWVDEFYNLDPVIRGPAQSPSLQIIDEIKVQQTGGSAQSGRNAGAGVLVSTRSGTSRIDVSLWEFFRNDHFDALNYFAPKSLPRPAYVRNQFGGTVGGPIKKDRTFFFAAFEGLRLKQGISRLATVPTERMRNGDLSELGVPDVPISEIHPLALEVIRAFPSPNLSGIRGNQAETGNRIENATNLTFKVDHTLSLRTLISMRFSSEVADVLDPFRSDTGGSPNLSNFGQTADRTKTSVGFSVITSLSRGLNEFRAGYNRVSQPVVPVNPGTPLQAPLMGFEKTFLTFSIKGFDSLGSGAEFTRAVNVFNYTDALSLDVGAHRLKTGVDVLRYLFNSTIVQPNIFSFDGTRSGSPLADFLRGLPALTVSFNGSPGGNIQKTELAWYVQDDWKVTRRLTLNYGLRWEYYGRILENVNKQSLWLPDCNCIRTAGNGLPDQLVDNDFNNFAPRLGLAYRPLSNRRMVIKASGGIYYDNDMRHNSELINNPPFFRQDAFLAMFAPTLSLDNPYPSGAGLSTLQPVTLDRKYRDSYAQVWSLGVQDELPSGILLDINYVGNHALKMRRLRNLNQPINGALPYAGFAQIFAFEEAGSSSFNSLQARVERQLGRGLKFISSYTWSHAIDDRPGQGALLPQDSDNTRAERGDSDYDVRHRWTLSAVWEAPIGPGRRWGNQLRGLGGALLSGWTISGISAVQSGRPFTVNFGLTDWSHTGNYSDRPSAVPGIDWRPSDQRPDKWIDAAAFSVPAPGSFGNLGRNTLRGPGLFNLDLSLAKTHALGEQARLEIRADFFNALNHPNFNLPAAALPTIPSSSTPTTFGVISSTSSPERQIQFGLRLKY